MGEYRIKNVYLVPSYIILLNNTYHTGLSIVNKYNI